MQTRPVIALLGHMRSYSSVLAHILGSHPLICGYSELHRETLTARGLVEVHGILSQRDDFTTASYLLDKLLHNGLLPPERIATDLIESGLIVPLVICRPPEITLKSIIFMGQHYCSDAALQAQLTDIELVTRYYVLRVDWLRRFVLRFGDFCLLLRAEHLLSDPLPTLEKIASWLELDTPLSTSYQLFANTGLAGHGDPSPSIRCGKLIEQAGGSNSQGHDGQIEIPAAHLSAAQQAYESLWDCERMAYMA